MWRSISLIRGLGFFWTGLRTLALAYRDFEEYSEEEFGTLESAPENELTLLGIVGIKDPVRKQVPDAMKLCRKAGVTVRMVTGDSCVAKRFSDVVVAAALLDVCVVSCCDMHFCWGLGGFFAINHLDRPGYCQAYCSGMWHFRRDQAHCDGGARIS